MKTRINTIFRAGTAASFVFDGVLRDCVFPEREKSNAVFLLVPVDVQVFSNKHKFQPGLEEFEEKVDRIAEGEDDGENSWISKIYNQFSFFNDGENSLEENDMDGLEPPLLDETWGLGVRTRGKGENSTKIF